MLLLAVATTTFISAVISLLTTAQSRERMKAGAVDANTLSDLTGIFARKDLDARFRRIGPNLYVVDKDTVEAARTPLHRFLNDPSLDSVSALAAIASLLLWSWPLAIAAAAYEIASWGWSALIVVRNYNDL